MLRPYQKAYLKSLANTTSHRYLLGKGEVDEGFLKEINAALEAKELIKVGLLPNSSSKPKEVGSALEQALGCDVVQVIGRVIVLYRRSVKNPKIVVPTREKEK